MANSILENKKFTEQEVFGTTAILTESNPHMEYVNGNKTGKQLGLKYIIVAPERRYEKITVKVAGEVNPIITNEELDKRNGGRNPVYVRFTGFEARLWQNWRDENNLEVGATASKIDLVDTGIVKGEVK